MAWRNYNFLIVCSFAAKLGPNALLLLATNLKVLCFIINISNCIGLLSDCIIWMCNTCPLKALLKLEHCLPSLPMNTLDFLVTWFRACATLCYDRRITANFCADQILGGIIWTKAVSVVFKRDFTVMDSAAGTANSKIKFWVA